ncbi:uncharacterized protein NMK_1946 [Novimethylophilus kurashikiensis]|uniref:Haemolysin activator HlyB C-terminal domain-containing protein n=1 Tax=Novimethylophilus kurashikiensis TaxID=1825523 RepID=A0A2R5F827_9PROT|nr:ShlB/FhaC/HecB family hemolysin secretion/activation protein [Novimethylophilus kurashikiensis]GBG14347.1 uncharacterized protein NMK_1946 [Novimethylophilus kurashikiensis]
MKNTAIVAAIMALCASAVYASAADETNPTARVTGYVLPDGMDTSYLSQYTGPEVSFSDLDAARQAVQRVLDASHPGWVAVLPAQDISTGQVHINIEKKLFGKVDINPALMPYFPSAKEGAPLDREGVETDLLLLADLSKPHDHIWGAAEHGATSLKVEGDPITTQQWLMLDNTGTQRTGQHRATYLIKSPMGATSSVYAALVASVEKPDAVHAMVAGVRVPFMASGLIADLYGATSKANIGDVGPLTLAGGGSSLGVKLTKFIPDQDKGSHEYYGGVEAREYHSTTTYGGQEITLTPDYHLIPITAGLRVTRKDWRGDASLTQGMAGADLSQVRSGAVSDYRILRGTWERVVALANFRLRVLATGQYTPNALPAGEQFGLGGASSVRGYSERAVAQDSGYSATAEISHALPVGPRWVGRVFADIGEGYRNKALPGEVSHDKLASVGAGVTYGDGVSPIVARADVAKAMTSLQNSTTDKGGWSVHFSVSYRF